MIMDQSAEILSKRIYIAPLQGFTDYYFRAAFIQAFGEPTAAFSPFIETHKLSPRSYRDVLPERNAGCNLIPQIMGNNATEMLPVIEQLQQMGYGEVNWNLGCPHPMVTKKFMGAGLLPFPERIDAILNELFSRIQCRLSIKMRLGLADGNDWKALVPVLNRYPLSEVIVHGRTALQMYKGEVDELAFGEMAQLLQPPVCYNGNVASLGDFNRLTALFPNVSRWMIGRGLLSNPLLLREIQTGEKASEAEIIKAIEQLHELLIYQYSISFSGEAHVFNKIKPYWEYFNLAFPGKEKDLKKIKKTVALKAYLRSCNELFRS
jgi:tRNA-dihydrouridine synthase